MLTYTKLDIIIIAIMAVILIACLLYLRFAPTYISNRSRRYIKPPKRRKHRKGVSE